MEERERDPAELHACVAYGLGAMMRKTAGRCSLRPKEECVAPPGLVGGGMTMYEGLTCAEALDSHDRERGASTVKPHKLPSPTEACVETRELKTCQANPRTGQLFCKAARPDADQFNITGSDTPSRIAKALSVLDTIDQRLASHEADVEEGAIPFLDEYKSLIRSQRMTAAQKQQVVEGTKKAIAAAKAQLKALEGKLDDSESDLKILEEEQASRDADKTSSTHEVTAYGNMQKSLIAQLRQHVNDVLGASPRKTA